MVVNKVFDTYNEVIKYLDDAQRVYSKIKQKYSHEIFILNSKSNYNYKVTIHLYESI